MKPYHSFHTALAAALAWAALAAGGLPGAALAQTVISDDLTKPTSSYDWVSSNGACLTAGAKGSTSGSIPACSGLAYYTSTLVGGTGGNMPDNSGEGALRLTNGLNSTNQTGSVVSNFTIPTNQGVQVTFSTVTYGGNAYTNSSNVKSGADGIAFFLSDGTKTPTIGAFGGSLGYSCSNAKGDASNVTGADGVDGAYVGVAIDEFGNFSNPSDNTVTGPGQTPGTIVVRGAGSISWAALNRDYPQYYPSTFPVPSSGAVSQAATRVAAVQNTCKTGKLWNYNNLVSTTTTSTSNGNGKGGKGTTTTTTTTTFTPVNTGIAVNDYGIIGTPAAIASGYTIFNQESNVTSKPIRDSANVLTYSLSITQDNLLSLTYNINGGSSIPVITSTSITSGNGPLPASFRFGFVAGTGGGTNVHEITCFKAAAINSAANSAGTNVQQSSKVTVGTQVYLSYYHPLNSWGQLVATGLSADTSNIVTVNGTANWDAGCALTGGTCSATTATGATAAVVAAQTPASRNILSWRSATSAVAAAGVLFDYANLSTTQQAALGATAAEAKLRIAYLRGARSNEISATLTGGYRKRDSVLGDIRSSSPTWVGAPSSSYTVAGSDLLIKAAVAEFGTSYQAFVTANKTRLNVVYNGANDGMLHGFRAGYYNADGSYNSAGNDGQEVIAYVPDAAVTSIHSTSSTALDYSSASYGHNYFVDATPGTGDLYYAGKWHTWLVGGLGAGGNAAGASNDTITNSAASTTTPSTDKGVLYALDITSPDSFAATGAAAVIGEWSSDSLGCVNDVACLRKFGAQYGIPIIRKLHDGNWAVIFGNGRNSLDGAAGIFIMTVNYADGSRTFRYLDTGASSGTTKNGIDFVVSADLDSDHVTDYVYAGDTAGNLWRFDLTSATPASWSVSKLFATPTGQPISTRVTVSSVVQASGAPRVLLNFGTGRMTPQTLTSAAKYSTTSQYLYGIWDWNQTAWNTNSTVQYATLPTTQAQVAIADLQTQTLTDNAGGSGSISGYRTETQNPVCWKGAAYCSTGNTQLGWMVKLPGAAEQVIYNPTVVSGVLYYNTYIPGVDQALSCTTTAAAGYTMAISPETGGALSASAFASAATAAGISSSALIVGLGLGATGTPSFVTAGSNTFLVQQTVTGSAVAVQVDPAAAVAGKRLTWRKLR